MIVSLLVEPKIAKVVDIAKLCINVSELINNTNHINVKQISPEIENKEEGNVILPVFEIILEYNIKQKKSRIFQKFFCKSDNPPRPSVNGKIMFYSFWRIQQCTIFIRLSAEWNLIKKNETSSRTTSNKTRISHITFACFA